MQTVAQIKRCGLCTITVSLFLIFDT